MKKFLKIAGIVLLSALITAILFYCYASYRVSQRLHQQYEVAVEEFAVPDDSASIAKGKHLVAIKGCADCHGDNLAGKVFNDDVMIGKLAGPNLTSGTGGIPPDYSTADWIKALKHGLNRDNRPLVVMPSLETSKMSKADMKAIIAYLKRLPPVNNETPESSLGPVITAMAHLDNVDVIAAEKIDHHAMLADSIDESSPITYGKYLAVMCSACHRDNMKGGDPLAPGFPPVPDLTSTGAAGKWTQDVFNAVLRTGKRPDGTSLDASMPWQMTQHYSDKELNALYTYFKTL